MKKVLVIGSAVVDVVIHLPHLPEEERGCACNIQKMSLGGCAYNASDTIRHFKVPYIPFFQWGPSVWRFCKKCTGRERNRFSGAEAGDRKRQLLLLFCVKMTEKNFACYHGAEYRFQKEWFDALDASEIDSVYICGLEIEEETGTNILSYLEEHPSLPYFCSGSENHTVGSKAVERVFALHPILHLNQQGDHFLYRKRRTEGGSRGNPSVYAKYGDRYLGSRRLLLL